MSPALAVVADALRHRGPVDPSNAAKSPISGTERVSALPKPDYTRARR
jgi:hypothetical protein